MSARWGSPTCVIVSFRPQRLLVLEPIFEADFLDSSYGFRPRRRAHDALDAIRAEIKAGRRSVYDADLKGYFDSIPHDKLMAAVQQRVVDRSVLSLIRMWLDAVVFDEREGGPRRNRQGTPQGGVISPLLANIYLHWFDKAFHGKHGPARFADARLVRYADDFVVLARHQSHQLVEWIERTLEGRLGLELNQEKTRIVDLAVVGSSVDLKVGPSISVGGTRESPCREAPAVGSKPAPNAAIAPDGLRPRRPWNINRPPPP